MEYIIFALLAVVLAETAVLAGREILDRWQGRGQADERTEEETDLEKKWQEGMSAMIGYDLGAARKAVRRDDDEDR